ncbi:DUF502 domain-containing protein [Anatilimnocola floriformis]|uniref:DUF502 domain-containing protein n=1 Tax=Anatilimnocola floriformis TaxID=2948575 RepID=UPI0020C4E89D|nr:DUF502 domain-containing protein [Anatilimnocola floriformis]
MYIIRSRSLRRVINFVKSTVVGGIFVLVPLVLLCVVLGQAATFAYEIIHPVILLMPVHNASTVSLAFAIAILVVVLVCFLAGLLARTAVSQWFVGSLEQVILTFVPGYGLMKSMGQGWVGIRGEEPHQPVLVQFDDSAQIGFLMDTLADGRQVIFVPDVPTPWSGTLVLMAAERISPLPFSTKQAIDCLRQLGANSSKLLSKMR